MTELENSIKILEEHTQYYVPTEDLEHLYAVIETAEKLAKYETAEEEGRLVVLPCDTVYFIHTNKIGRAHVRAKSILDLYLHEILGIDKDGKYWSDKEEAEKALKEMENA